MGETTIRSARVAGALGAALTATVLLASCAGLRAGGTATPAADVTASPTSSATADAPTVAPTETATASVAPTTEPTGTVEAAKATVTPFVTSATWNADDVRIDVSALVPKVVERDGTCTATATRAGVAVTASGPAVATASYTGCSQLALSGSKLVAGSWKVQVAYSSPESSGTSASTTVTVG